MIRIVLLLTLFTFLDGIITALQNKRVTPRRLSFTKKTKAKTVSWKTRNLDTTTIRTLPWKSEDMDKFVRQLEEECNFELLNEIHYELKNLWDNVMQGLLKDMQGRHSIKPDLPKHTHISLTLSRNVIAMFVYIALHRMAEHFEGFNDLIKKMKYEIFLLFLDGRENNLSEMVDVRIFFKKLIDGYNNCSEKKLHINSDGEWEIYMKIFEEELKKMNGFRLPPAILNGKPTRKARNAEESLVYCYNPNISVPDSVDWRARGYVNAVKHQGTCNACYAMAANGALEAYHKKKEGELVRLSTQNILDCTWYLGNNGCVGGNPYSVFQYARSVGVASNYYYPYTMNASHICNWKYQHVAATDEGYYAVDYENELALWHAVAEHGPVAIGLGVNGIHGYRSGVFYTDDCGPIVHVALVVGYGTDPKQGEYWLVKNSWGFWWGKGGYIRIARNKSNVCGIASYAHFPF